MLIKTCLVALTDLECQQITDLIEKRPGCVQHAIGQQQDGGWWGGCYSMRLSRSAGYKVI